MPRRSRVALVEADVGDLGIGVGAPGHVQGAEPLAAEEERVLDDDAGGEVGGVGELPVHADVAGGEDARVGGAQVVVDLHAAPRVVRDADRLETETVDVGRAAGADEDLVDAHLVLAVAGWRTRRTTCRGRRARASSSSARRAPGGRPRAANGALHDLGRVGVLAVEDVGRCRGTASPRQPRRWKACASSQPIGPAPITARRRGRSVSEKTVSLVRKPTSASPGIGGLRGARAGGDDGLLEAQRLAADLDGVGAGEARVAEEDVDRLLVAEALRRVVGADARAQAAHALP